MATIGRSKAIAETFGFKIQKGLSPGVMWLFLHVFSHRFFEIGWP